MSDAMRTRGVKVGVRMMVPTVPNYLRTGDGTAVAICQCTDEELRAVAAEWTEELIARAHRQRANVNREYERRSR